MEVEGFADEADGFEPSVEMNSSADPKIRQANRIMQQRKDVAVIDSALQAADAIATSLKVVKRILVGTSVGRMRVTVHGCMPSEGPVSLLLVSNPGADCQVCYGNFLSRAASQIPSLTRASIVFIDLPGQLPSPEYTPDGAGTDCDEPPQAAAQRSEAEAPALVPFGSLARAVVDCAAAVRCGEAIGVGAHAGAWLLMSAQSHRPGLLRGLLVCGATDTSPSGGEATTLASLGWTLGSYGWTAWARDALARTMLSSTGAGSALGAAVREGTRDWDPAWVAALLSGWSARPTLDDRALRQAVHGSETFTTDSGKVMGGSSALESTVLLQNTVPGGGSPMCDVSHGVAWLWFVAASTSLKHLQM